MSYPVFVVAIAFLKTAPSARQRATHATARMSTYY